jgi:hypothetical protein
MGVLLCSPGLSANMGRQPTPDSVRWLGLAAAHVLFTLGTLVIGMLCSVAWDMVVPQKRYYSMLQTTTASSFAEHACFDIYWQYNQHNQPQACPPPTQHATQAWQTYIVHWHQNQCRAESR